MFEVGIYQQVLPRPSKFTAYILLAVWLHISQYYFIDTPILIEIDALFVCYKTCACIIYSDFTLRIYFLCNLIITVRLIGCITLPKFKICIIFSSSSKISFPSFSIMILSQNISFAAINAAQPFWYWMNADGLNYVKTSNLSSNEFFFSSLGCTFCTIIINEFQDLKNLKSNLVKSLMIWPLTKSKCYYAVTQ